MKRKSIRFWFSVQLGAALIMLYCPISMANAADIYDEQSHVVIEQVTEGDIPKLVVLLGDKDPTVRGKAEDFLVSFAGKSVPGLIDALDKGANPYQVIDVLGRINDPRAIAPIFKYVDDRNGDVSLKSSQVLIGMWDKSAPFLIDKLAKKEKIKASTNILAQISRTDDLAKSLRNMLSSPDAVLRGASAYILGEWHDAASAGEIETLLGDKDMGVRENAVAAYQKVTSNYNQKLLVSLLKDESDTVRMKAADLLSNVQDVEPALIAAPLTNAATKDKSVEVRKNALWALAARDVAGASLVLIEALYDPDWDVQATALSGIAELKDEAAVPYIMKMFKEHRINNKHALNQACRALISIGKPVEIEPFFPYFETLHDQQHPTRSLLSLIKTFVTDANRKQAIEAIQKFMGTTSDSMILSIAQETIDSINK
jgi:HEAT repeat protein